LATGAGAILNLRIAATMSKPWSPAPQLSLSRFESSLWLGLKVLFSRSGGPPEKAKVESTASGWVSLKPLSGDVIRKRSHEIEVSAVDAATLPLRKPDPRKAGGAAADEASGDERDGAGQGAGADAGAGGGAGAGSNRSSYLSPSRAAAAAALSSPRRAPPQSEPQRKPDARPAAADVVGSDSASRAF
jgi:hypothetical protein